ncbi:DNA binding HTH domain-containing protein [Sphingomonas antarctica]
MKVGGQVSGHARTGETPRRPRQSGVIDDKLEAALREFRRIGNRELAAKSVNVAPERFRRFLRETVEVVGRGASLKITDNRHREMTVYTRGEARELRLPDFDQASLNGRHLAAVGEFIRTNEIELLAPFAGREVTDAKGKRHPLETDPNALHRIAASGEGVFHEIYRLIS